MEINLTSLIETDMFAFSHSRAEGGEDAGRNTWNAAKEHVTSEISLLPTEEACQEFRDYMKDFGAWNDEERAAWDAAECNALLLQLIAGDVREAGADDLASIDWEEYEKDASAGRISGNLFRADDGTVYYQMCH